MVLSFPASLDSSPFSVLSRLSSCSSRKLPQFSICVCKEHQRRAGFTGAIPPTLKSVSSGEKISRRSVKKNGEKRGLNVPEQRKLFLSLCLSRTLYSEQEPPYRQSLFDINIPCRIVWGQPLEMLENKRYKESSSVMLASSFVVHRGDRNDTWTAKRGGG